MSRVQNHVALTVIRFGGSSLPRVKYKETLKGKDTIAQKHSFFSYSFILSIHLFLFLPQQYHILKITFTSAFFCQFILALNLSLGVEGILVTGSFDRFIHVLGVWT